MQIPVQSRRSLHTALHGLAEVPTVNKTVGSVYGVPIVVETADPRYTAPTDLPWYCSWFGVSCPPPPVPYNAAPETETQMTVPGEWTPDQARAESWSNYVAQVKKYFETAANEGVATVPAAASQAGDAIASAAPKVGLLLLAVGALALFVVVKAR